MKVWLLLVAFCMMNVTSAFAGKLTNAEIAFCQGNYDGCLGSCDWLADDCTENGGSVASCREEHESCYRYCNSDQLYCFQVAQL